MLDGPQRMGDAWQRFYREAVGFMHIHILGICGTFMGSLAVLARELGHKVTGSDQGVYPPMSTQLQAQGIELIEGYHPDNLKPRPDLVLIGNAMSRGWNRCLTAIFLICPAPNGWRGKCCTNVGCWR